MHKALALGLVLVGVAHAEGVVMEFAVMGGCRMAYDDLAKQGASNPSSANVPQLTQTLKDLARIGKVPSPFFCTGDIVNNLEHDEGQLLKAQLTAWREIVAKSELWGKTELVVTPGNHEVLMHVKDKGEIPNSAAYTIFEDWSTSPGLNAPAGNGPAKGGADRLTADQQRSTFSFDRNGVHFVVVNTDSPGEVVDPVTQAPYVGWAPVAWIKKDMAAAQANAAVKHIFVLGHRPLGALHNAEEEEPALLNASAPGLNIADQLREIMMTTKKFRAYLTGHEHMWEARRMGAPGAPWEIVIGNGGSPLNTKWVKAGNNYFGFTVVRVYESGRVGVVNWRRAGPEIQTDYFNPKTEPARPDAEFFLE